MPATNNISIIQYLMLKDANEARWQKLYATDCRVDALAYGQHAYTESERVAWIALSPEDRSRLMSMHRPFRTL